MPEKWINLAELWKRGFNISDDPTLSVNPYWKLFGTIARRYLRKQNSKIIFLTCDNGIVTSYVTDKVTVKVYVYDVTLHVRRRQLKIFKIKVQHREKSGCITQRYLRKRNSNDYLDNRTPFAEERSINI